MKFLFLVSTLAFYFSYSNAAIEKSDGEKPKGPKVTEKVSTKKVKSLKISEATSRLFRFILT